VLTIAIGINDAVLGLVEPSEFGIMYRACLDIIRQRRPNRPVACISPIVCTMEKSETGVPVTALTARIRQVIRDVVERFDGPCAFHVNGLHLLSEESALIDDIHPAMAGHALMAERLAPRLASLLRGNHSC